MFHFFKNFSLLLFNSKPVISDDFLAILRYYLVLLRIDIMQSTSIY